MQQIGIAQRFKEISIQANYWLIILIPLLITALINYLIQNGVYPVEKKDLELLAIIILCTFCTLCFMRLIVNKEKFFMWATALLVVFLVREIHPPGSSEGVYLGIIVLLYVAHKYFSYLSDYLLSPKLLTLLGIGFFTYIISVTIDQRLWKFVPGEELAHVPLEETLEVIGHLIVGLALFSASKCNGSSDNKVI